MTDNIGLGILIAAVVTATIRIVPIVFLARRKYPKPIRYWLNFVPAAVLSAIIAAEIVDKNQYTSFGISVALAATVTAVLAGVLTRSLFATVIVSILDYLLFQNI